MYKFVCIYVRICLTHSQKRPTFLLEINVDDKTVSHISSNVLFRRKCLGMQLYNKKRRINEIIHDMPFFIVFFLVYLYVLICFLICYCLVLIVVTQDLKCSSVMLRSTVLLVY